MFKNAPANPLLLDVSDTFFAYSSCSVPISSATKSFSAEMKFHLKLQREFLPLYCAGTLLLFPFQPADASKGDQFIVHGAQTHFDGMVKI